MYKKAVYGGLASGGEIVPATEGVKLERSLRAKKAAETRKYRLAEPVQEPTNTPGFVPPENISEDGTFLIPLLSVVLKLMFGNLMNTLVTYYYRG